MTFSGAGLSPHSERVLDPYCLWMYGGAVISFKALKLRKTYPIEISKRSQGAASAQHWPFHIAGYKGFHVVRNPRFSAAFGVWGKWLRIQLKALGTTR